MTDSFTADVLICGAGAAGLTLAIDLARRGVSFRLIEKMDEPFAGSRGKALQPRTQEVFEDLGIIDKIFAAGGYYPPQWEHQADGTHVESEVMEINNPTPAEPFQIPLMVAQFRTEEIMRDRLAELGHEAEFGCELISFEQDEAGISAVVMGMRGEEKLRVQYLAGTDGGRSFTRRALDIDFQGKTLGIRAVVADMMLTGLERDAWHRFKNGPMSKQMSLCPLMGTDMFQLQAPVAPEGDINLTAEGLTQMVAERTDRNDIKIQSVFWASVFTPNARLAEHYRSGRVFLAGDAAHTHPPTGGQGLNTSVQDAYNLGWKLAAAIAGSTTVLDTYEEERRPIAADMLGLATKLLEAIKQGELRRGREVHQLDIGYPDSSLALEMPERRLGILAGDRAPDAPLLGASGQKLRLFDLFKGPHWTLLGYEAEHAPVASRTGLHMHIIGKHGEVFDDGGHFQDAYGLAIGDWVLVRPDGYIGAIVAGSEVAALEPYFRDVGLTLH